MHIQASSVEGLACYWSSWHDAARDSEEMSKFLGMHDCLGVFIVAPHRRDRRPRADSRVREASGHEWRQ